jgi:hypothetical protein
MMNRNRLYTSNAERQKAYRERLAATHPAAPTIPAISLKRKRPPSRPERLALVLTEVQALAAEYEEWLEALPEQFQEGTLADKLSDTVEKLNGAADLLSEVDVPKGFGRD